MTKLLGVSQSSCAIGLSRRYLRFTPRLKTALRILSFAFRVEGAYLESTLSIACGEISETRVSSRVRIDSPVSFKSFKYLALRFLGSPRYSSNTTLHGRLAVLSRCRCTCSRTASSTMLAALRLKSLRSQDDQSANSQISCWTDSVVLRRKSRLIAYKNVCLKA